MRWFYFNPHLFQGCFYFILLYIYVDTHKHTHLCIFYFGVSFVATSFVDVGFSNFDQWDFPGMNCADKEDYSL